MSVIVLLIIASVLVAGSFLVAFIWAVRTGQFEDKHTPAMRILFDDKPEKKKNSHNHTNQGTEQ